MRFVTFRALNDAAGRAVAGVLVDDERVADLSHPSCKALLHGTAPSLQSFIEQGLAGWVQRLTGVSDGSRTPSWTGIGMLPRGKRRDRLRQITDRLVEELKTGFWWTTHAPRPSPHSCAKSDASPGDR